MTTQSDLESRVRLALEKLAKGAAGDFDMAAYGRAFHPSARSKARTVVDTLSDQHNPFKHLNPVFVSVGGADGEELEFLLTHTTAQSGILIERSRDLAQVARDRTLPSGKKIEVFEGDATDTIRSAIEASSHLVRSKRAGYQAVTCHAVIHELFDRGRTGFDPAAFFSTVFGDRTIPTWFTYREPGAPSKWPEEVLVSADCGPILLQQLAEVLVARQHSLGQLRPSPHVMGDHVRAHRDLAMELIIKLFYIEDLWYEVQERSTSVDHQQMQSFLALAIGDNAVKEKRGLVTSSSSATDSFQNLWKEWGIRVAGLNLNGSRYDLPVPESQTRVIAWRSPDTVSASEGQPLADRSGEVPADLAIALSASIVGDINLLEALLISKGRSWIEQDHRDEALKLLTSAREKHSNDTLVHLWSDYHHFPGPPYYSNHWRVDLVIPPTELQMGSAVVGDKIYPAKEVLVSATGEVAAQRAADLIHAARLILQGSNLLSHLYPGEHAPVYPASLTSASSLEEDESEFLSRRQVMTSGIPLACLIATHASRRLDYMYALAKLRLSLETFSFPTIELDPMHSDNIPKSPLPEDHVRMAFAIVSAWSAIEELGLEIRASSKKPSKLADGSWNPVVKQELESRLLNSHVNLKEDIHWSLRGPRTRIERKYSDGVRGFGFLEELHQPMRRTGFPLGTIDHLSAVFVNSPFFSLFSQHSMETQRSCPESRWPRCRVSKAYLQSGHQIVRYRRHGKKPLCC